MPFCLLVHPVQKVMRNLAVARMFRPGFDIPFAVEGQSNLFDDFPGVADLIRMRPARNSASASKNPVTIADNRLSRERAGKGAISTLR